MKLTEKASRSLLKNLGFAVDKSTTLKRLEAKIATLKSDPELRKGTSVLEDEEERQLLTEILEFQESGGTVLLIPATAKKSEGEKKEVATVTAPKKKTTKEVPTVE